MTVYRITLEKYADALVASGNPARWNSRDVKMIYTASTRSLACLENVVHRNAIGLQQRFRVLVIDIPVTLLIHMVEKSNLPGDWYKFENVSATRKIGDDWINGNESPILRVPSAIIAEEYNYLLNPGHQDFKKIKLLRSEPFVFDPRIKE